MQTIGESHESLVDLHVFDKPDMDLRSRPAITHVASGSPFAAHGAIDLAGCIVRRLEGPNESRDVETLDEVDRAMREIDPVVLVLHDGSRVGASRTDVHEYDSQQVDDALRRGRHTVMHGPLAAVTFDSSVREKTRPPPDGMVPNTPASTLVPAEYDDAP